MLSRNPYPIPRVKVVDINPKSFNCKFKLPLESSKSCHRQVCLTVINHKWLYSLEENNFFSLFFDLNSGTAFNFIKTIKLLSYPAFKIKASTYKHLMTMICCELIMKLEFKHFVCPDDSPCYLRVLKHRFESFTYAEKKKVKRTTRNFGKVLDSYSFVEEVQLNLFDVPRKQKVSIINNLSKNLKTLQLVFFQPISFLLYIGKRLENLETLDVWYISEKFYVCVCPNEHSVKQCTYFDKLINERLVAFESLKCFKISICNHDHNFNPLLLKTILTVLKCSQKTLTSFHLDDYKFDDVSKIIDFVCSENMPLKFISLKEVKFLTVHDIMKIAKVMNSSDLTMKIKLTDGGVVKFAKFIKNVELFIKIEGCRQITSQDMKVVFSYIKNNNLNIKIDIKYAVVYE